MDELAAETRQGDSYLARVGRLVAARAIAEELILPSGSCQKPNRQQTTSMTNRRT